MGKKIQFLLKNNEVYSFNHFFPKHRSSGLWNSVGHIRRSLRLEKKLTVDVRGCQDNNEIDKFVSSFKPDIVIIEALWVVPEKFKVLKKLHPGVKWFVRLHSNISFLALEGIAVEWLKGYERENVGILVNSKECEKALKVFLNKGSVEYLPNIYKSNFKKPKRLSNEISTLYVGCFGAIRPFKNQLIQAIAAIEYADRNGLKLYYCINGERIETGGEPVIKNIRALFDTNKLHCLIEIPWCEIDQFKNWVKMMDVGLQVSFTETFNIVSADCLSQGVPIVGGKAIPWLSRFSQAKSDSVESIVRQMDRAISCPLLTWWNQWLLKRQSKRARKEWIRWCLS